MNSFKDGFVKPDSSTKCKVLIALFVYQRVGDPASDYRMTIARGFVQKAFLWSKLSKNKGYESPICQLILSG